MPTTPLGSSGRVSARVFDWQGDLAQRSASTDLGTNVVSAVIATDQERRIPMEPGRGSGPLSRFVHVLDRATSRPIVAAVAAVLVVAFVVALAFAGFPSSWETAFATACAGVTTVMVFMIQHTQSREQAATQLKLDELIRALPQADDHLVHVEAGSDDELAELRERHLEHHRAVRDTE